MASTFLLLGSAIAACSGHIDEVCGPGNASCVVDADGGSGGTCTYGGATYRVGQSFRDSDDCNTCSCAAGGAIQCTTMACPKKDGGKDPGTWSKCCEQGHVSQCYCPPGAACNYGWFTDCGDGICVDGPQIDDAGVCGRRDAGRDAKPPPAEDGGTWEACCMNGHVDKCFCPAGVACNYGWFDDCGDGTCNAGFGDAGTCARRDGGARCTMDGGSYAPGETFPSPDGCNTCVCGANGSVSCTEKACVDSGAGHSYVYCLNGYLQDGYCPPGVSCSPEPYDDCGNGRCAIGGACPP